MHDSAPPASLDAAAGSTPAAGDAAAGAGPAPELRLRRLLHELSTPVGVGAMAASLLTTQLDALLASLESATLHRLQERADEWRETASLVQSSLRLCAQILRNQSHAAPPDRSALPAMNLHAVIQDSVAIQLARRPDLQVKVELQGSSAALEIRSVPGVWHQMLGNLVANSLLHGFQGRSGGSIQISAHALPGPRVRVDYRDDGVGLSAAARAQLFDDGFSTRLGHGGHGLGMGIVRDLVCRQLGGSIEVHPAAAGVHFSLETPA